MEATGESTTCTRSKIEIPEFRITRGMIEAFREGTHDPFIEMHSGDSAVALGFQLEMLVAEKIRQVADVDQYCSQQSKFCNFVRADDIVRIEARREASGIHAELYVKGIADPAMRTRIAYGSLEEGINEPIRGQKYVLIEEDLRKVQEGLGTPKERELYPLALGRASEPLVELARTSDAVKERMRTHRPVYVKHEIRTYRAIHGLRPGDEIAIQPKICGERYGIVKTEAHAQTGDGKALYTMEISLVFMKPEEFEAKLRR